MFKVISLVLCILSFSSVNASRMGRLYYAITEGVVNEFSTNLSIEETEDAFDSIKLSMTSKQIAGCDLTYKGSVVVKEEKIFFDVCVDINTDRTFNVAVSERQEND